MGITDDIIRELVPDALADPNMSASQFMAYHWQQYEMRPDNSNSINGKIFEMLIARTLVRANIMPFYMQARIAFIPNVDYDFVLYTQENGPIVLSAKTSLRERYKQADLEAVVLKNIHRQSKCYVLSRSTSEINARRQRLDELMAIDDFFNVESPEYDDLLSELTGFTLIAAPTFQAVTSGAFIQNMASL